LRRTPTVSFANFICRFGDRLTLLDLATEVVLPAFLDPSLTRKYGPSRYFLYQMKRRVLPASSTNELPTLILYGRFVKDTVLTRSQIFTQEQGLVEQEASIASAPSSFFVLILNNHKLIYLPETADAPSLDTFASTVHGFLRTKHRLYIDRLYQNLKGSDAPPTKKHLYEEYPPPDVEVLPLASKTSIDNFVDTFDTLTQLEFRILDTNQELQMQETYQRLREMKDSIGSKKTKLIHSNSAGLDKTQAKEQIHASAATGNQEVKLTGTASDRTRVSGDNQHFKLQVPLGDIADDPFERARQLVETYRRQIEQGTLAEDTAQDFEEKLQSLLERLNEQ